MVLLSSKPWNVQLITEFQFKLLQLNLHGENAGTLQTRSPHERKFIPFLSE